MERAFHQHRGGGSADHHGRHTHVHGVVDAQLETTARGLAALKCSFIVLAGGAVLRVALLTVSGSRRAGRQVRGIRDVRQVRARWIGHRLHAEADIAIDPSFSLGEGIGLALRFEFEVVSHLPEIRTIHVGIRSAEESPA